MKKIVSLYIVILVIIFLVFNNFVIIKFWELYFIESKKKEIKYIANNILDILKTNNLDKDLGYFDRNYLLYLFSNLPEYVYFIVYDQNYRVLLYYPVFFNVDYDFLKKNPFGIERVVFDNYVLTYFLPVNRYMLAVEMNLAFIKSIRKELIYMALGIILFSFPFSYLLAIFIFKLIEKRINIIKDFVSNVSLGKFNYDIDYNFNDELKDIFIKIKLMKEFLIKYISEIEQNKKILEQIFNNSPFFVIIINNYDEIIYLNKPIDENLKSFFLKNLADVNLENQKIIKFNRFYFKMVVFDYNLNRIGIFIDITDFYSLSELKDKALAMVSHDLRTPISSIKANLQFLLTKDLQPDIKNKINSILLELDKINYMIYRYLDYSRIKLGKKISNFQLVKLLDFINFINDFINFLEYSENIEFNSEDIFNILENNLEFQNKNVLIDLEIFKQLLSNLLDNAYKYSIDKKVFLYIDFNKDKLYIKVGNLADLDSYNLIKQVIFNDSDLYLSKGKLGLLIIKELANILSIKIQIEKGEKLNEQYILLFFILEINYNN